MIQSIRRMSIIIGSVGFLLSACHKTHEPSSSESTLLVFRDGTWYSLPANSPQTANALRLGLIGQKGDQPVAADWDGAGLPRLGVFRKGTWFVDINDDFSYRPNEDKIFDFGADGDIPIAADWDGSGKQRVGVFRSGQWFLDTNGDFHWDSATDKGASFGQAGDIPVVGDWDGSGQVRIGVFRNGLWFLDTNGDRHWDPATDRMATFGQRDDVPVVGDWDGSGKTRIGVFRKGQWYLDLNGNQTWDGPGVEPTRKFWPAFGPACGPDSSWSRRTEKLDGVNLLPAVDIYRWAALDPTRAR